MQPVKITIEGDYIDCQIYRGRLYLWTLNGTLNVYKWNDIVNSFIESDIDLIAMTYCFIDSAYIYQPSLTQLFKDEGFKTLLRQRFAVLDDREFYLDEKQASTHLIKAQDTPGKIIPTDTEIYNNTLYYIHEAGLFSASAHRSSSHGNPVSSRPNKLWDCKLLSIKANKYPQLALSAGNDGLYELNWAEHSTVGLMRAETLNPIFVISDKHSTFANYAYLSIYNTSLVDSSYLALFKWNMSPERRVGGTRDFEETITESIIFQTENQRQHLSWGIQDKIYRATENGFEIVKFNNRADTRETQFNRLANIHLHPWKGRVIGGSAAYFGTIIECENALVLILSNEEVITIPGPITRWRVYPRSNNYENQLHVILDDRIEIYSFNHDYFLEQGNKSFGIEYIQGRHYDSARDIFE